MEKEPEQSTNPQLKIQKDTSNSGDAATVSVNYSLSMSIDGQSAKVDFGVCVPCINGVDEGFISAGEICESILPEKLKEVQLLVYHLKKTKDKIEKGDLNPLAKVEDET